MGCGASFGSRSNGGGTATSCGADLAANANDVHKSSTGHSTAPLPIEPERPPLSLPPHLPSFHTVFEALQSLRDELGGAAVIEVPVLGPKLKKIELVQQTDYEYAYLQVLGFQALQIYCEEIVALNNGAFYHKNPGIVRLERRCGFTMHGNRAGANAALRVAPETMLEAFSVAREEGVVLEFFQTAFDKTADPCLEGRLGRLLAFLEDRHSYDDSPDEPPWGDLCVEPLADDASAEHVIGEHLRTFNNLCVWRWAQSCKIPYSRAKQLWEEAEAHESDTKTDDNDQDRPAPRISSGALLPNVAELSNEKTFLAHLEAVGLVASDPSSTSQLSSTVEGSEGGDASKKETSQHRAFSRAEVERALLFYIEMQTLHPTPDGCEVD
mmetsp:Transcript_43366/g.120001  ORF Transcript_43366/g.120001 Transcript_43366/m.120001 type:complete len:382 (-) Transcript_43366:139-1284(-)